MGPSLFKCSFNPFDNNAVVVTGTNIYKYYKVKDLNEFVADHTQLNNKDRQISTQYSCHAWMQDTGRLIVCTENGEIMLCETSGEFMNFIHESPGEGYRITTIVPFSCGFIISGENGMISAYERVEDPQVPLPPHQEHRVQTGPDSAVPVDCLPHQLHVSDFHRGSAVLHHRQHATYQDQHSSRWH